MMTITVNFKDDRVTTRINGTLEEVAEHYFSQPEVKSIDIFSGGQMAKNEFYTKTATRIYRAHPADVQAFDLYYNIRIKCRIDRADGSHEAMDYGFLRIA